MKNFPVLVNSDPVIATLRTKRGWVLVGLGALIGAIVGMLWLAATPKTYEATVALELTSVAPQINITSVGARPAVVTIDTDAQIVTSDAVVDAVARTSTRDRTQIRDSLRVSARPLTRVMNVTYGADSEAEAIEGASAAAAAFLDERDRLIVQPVREYLRSVEGQWAPVAGVGGSSPSRDQWEIEARRLSALTAEMRLQGAGQVLEAASITASGDRGDAEVPVVTGASLGALLGLGFAIARAATRSAESTRSLATS